MKTLLFLRHGKSDWNTGEMPDADRPLAKRGRKDSKRMGRWLAKTGVMPDGVLTSDAVRARETLRLFRKAGGFTAPERATNALYMTDPETVLEEIAREPEDREVLMLVGHEPAWSRTVGTLVGGGEHTMSTAAMARVDFEVTSWTEIRPGMGTLIWLVPPAVAFAKKSR